MTAAVAPPHPAAARILRLPEVQVRTGKGRTAIYAEMAKGSFPQPVRLSARAVGWLESEVADWVASRIAERDSAAR